MTTGPASWTGPAVSVARPRHALARARRWLLPISLLANVFLLAHAAGPWIRPHRSAGFPGMVEHFAHSLPPDDAGRFRAAMESQRAEFERMRHEMDRSRAELSRAIAATPYDPAVAASRMEDWQAHLHLMSARFGETLLVAIPTLSPEGRARLADAAEHPPPGPPPPPPQEGPSPTRP